MGGVVLLAVVAVVSRNFVALQLSRLLPSPSPSSSYSIGECDLIFIRLHLSGFSVVVWIGFEVDS